jgi:hypothetical protein
MEYIRARANGAVFLFALLVAWNHAAANPIASVSVAAGIFNTRSLSGGGPPLLPGDTITVTYPPATVPASQTTTVGAGGKWVIFPPATVPAGTAATITSSNPACPGPTVTKVADAPNPPGGGVVVLAQDAILGGSTASLGSSSFALSGSFIVETDSFDSIPSSPTFGDIVGEVLPANFDVTGIGALGTIVFDLSASEPFDVNVSALIGAVPPVSAMFHVPLAGDLTLNGSSVAFSGSADGTVTWTDFTGAETFNTSLSLSSSLGPITGTVLASGQNQVVPEPATRSLMGLGLMGVLFLGGRRIRRKMVS